MDANKRVCELEAKLDDAQKKIRELEEQLYGERDYEFPTPPSSSGESDSQESASLFGESHQESKRCEVEADITSNGPCKCDVKALLLP